MLESQDPNLWLCYLISKLPELLRGWEFDLVREIWIHFLEGVTLEMGSEREVELCRESRGEKGVPV